MTLGSTSRLALLLCCIGSSAFANECHFYAEQGARQRIGDGVPDCKKANGLERCTENGKVVAEFHLKGDQRDGPGWLMVGRGRKLELHYKTAPPNKRDTWGWVDGPAKVFEKDGSLLCDLHFANNQAEGVSRETVGGKLTNIYLYQAGSTKGVLAFNPAGHLTHLTCAEKSFTPEDREPCGFTGKVHPTALYFERDEPSGVVVGYLNGKLASNEKTDSKKRKTVQVYSTPGNKEDYELQTFFPSGKPYQTSTFKNRELDGTFTELSESGQRVKLAHLVAGVPRDETTYFLNGNVKQKLVQVSPTKVSFQTFWDSGKTSEEGTYVVEERRGRRWSPDGWELYEKTDAFHAFWENGKPREDSHYADGKEEGPAKTFYSSGQLENDAAYHEGKLTRLKHYSETGVLDKDEEYYEDGSRKLKH